MKKLIKKIIKKSDQKNDQKSESIFDLGSYVLLFRTKSPDSQTIDAGAVDFVDLTFGGSKTGSKIIKFLIKKSSKKHQKNIKKLIKNHADFFLLPSQYITELILCQFTYVNIYTYIYIYIYYPGSRVYLHTYIHIYSFMNIHMCIFVNTHFQNIHVQKYVSTFVVIS